MSSKKTFSTRPALAALAMAFALMTSAAANAILVIEIDGGAIADGGIDGLIDFRAFDNDGVNDRSRRAGKVSALAEFGTDAEFSEFEIVAGSGAPDLGKLYDTNFLTTVARNTEWQIRIVDDNFMLGNTLSQLVQAFSIVTASTVSSAHTITLQTKVDGQIVLDSTKFVGGTNQSASTWVTLSEPSVIEHIITLKADGSTGEHVSTFDTLTTVPEPSVLGLMGLSLIGLGLVGRRRRQAA